MTSKPLHITDIISRGVLVLLAVCLQIQVTLFASDDYLGLRINTADFLIPFAGLFIIGSLAFKNSVWPRFKKPFGYWAPILLSTIIMLGILNGYRLQDSWSHWAIINKGVGWFVLMAYFAMAGWFSTNKGEEIRDWFFKPFMLFLCFITLSEIIIRSLFIYSIIEPFAFFSAFKVPEMAGFMANRNAFAFIYLTGLIISGIFIVQKWPVSRVEKICFHLLWLTLPLFIILNASRTSFLVLIPLVIFLIFKNWRLFMRSILPMIFIGSLFSPLVYQDATLRNFDNLSSITSLSDQQKRDEMYVGDQLRLEVAKDAFMLFKQNPLTGSGIGSTYEYQKAQGDRKYIAIIDNTPLWLLTELGPFGLIAFAAVFFSMLRSLYKKSQNDESFDGVFAYSVIIALIGFGIFSLLHEILYSRFFWVFLGLALAIPFSKKHQSE